MQEQYYRQKIGLDVWLGNATSMLFNLLFNYRLI